MIDWHKLVTALMVTVSVTLVASANAQTIDSYANQLFRPTIDVQVFSPQAS